MQMMFDSKKSSDNISHLCMIRLSVSNVSLNLAFQEEYEAHSKGTVRKKLCMLSKCELTGLQNNHNETHLTD